MEERRRPRRSCAVRLSDGRIVVVKVAATPLSRLCGLLGRRPPQPPLLLTRCSDIHTYGMAEPIDVAFIGGDGRVVKVERAVAPGQRVFSSALAHDGKASVLERFSQVGSWVMPGDYPLVSDDSLR